METQFMERSLHETALVFYSAARADGLEPAEAAEIAWIMVRRVPAGRRLRAARWDEAVALNTGSRRSYRSPLGEILGIAGAESFGGHAAEWRRTKRSLRAAEAMRARVLLELESACPRVREQLDDARLAFHARKANEAAARRRDGRLEAEACYDQDRCRP